MSSVPQTQQPTPALILDTMNAHVRSQALKAAIQLDVFTAVGEGSNTVPSIAVRCGASERGMRILCDYLVIIGLLAKDGTDYQLTADTAMFLDRRSPAYLGSAEHFLTSPLLMGAFQDLAAAVRKGGEVFSPHGTMEPNHPIWVEFARSMAPMMVVPAENIARLLGAGAWNVLDIAAGHGRFGIAIAQHNPEATITAVDWPAVLEVARENAEKAGVAGRYRIIPGSAFNVDFGSGRDLVLLTNFLHHFDPPTCEALLRKVLAALRPGGRAVTLEFVPNDDRVTPPQAAAFSMIMLGTTERGDAYTFAELERMFQNAGFRRSELHDLPPTPQRVIISYK